MKALGLYEGQEVDVINQDLTSCDDTCYDCDSDNDHSS